MSMKKSIREWLEELPDGYRELALHQRQLEINNGRDSDPIVDSMYQAIINNRTTTDPPPVNGDWSFWDNVASHYYDGTPLPKLPS